MDMFLHNVRAIYLHPNPFQVWAWVLTGFAILFLIKPWRRIGGIGILLALGCMGMYFGMMTVFRDYAPPDRSNKEIQRMQQQH
jgi:hypothetical protein